MYAELHCLSNFTFLKGASHPHELVLQALQLGYQALAITDECSVAGVVRAHAAVKKATEETGRTLQLIIGSEFRLDDGLRFVVLATSRTGYGQLCRLITVARHNGEKGDYLLERDNLFTDGAALAFLTECLALWLPAKEPDVEEGRWLAAAFPGRSWVAVELLANGSDRMWLRKMEKLSRDLQLPLVASGDVQMHVRGRRALQDVLTAIRHGLPLAAAGKQLASNGERHLRPFQRLRRLYPAPLLTATLDIAARCNFSLAELKYEYPEEIVPRKETPTSWLRKLTDRGMRRRWPEGAAPEVRKQIETELALIQDLRYEAFFLTVYDVVRYARRRGILCQGRGSAANSAVCFCLGITAVDPSRTTLMFGRFISRERNEPPDIDVDFEHERREEVIQYVYRKYGRHRAALAATVIRYRARSALRDAGKALGLDVHQVDRLARAMQWWDDGPDPARVREAGLDPESPVLRHLLALVPLLAGFPRHLSQHVGGFVIARDSLDLLVPVENASMPDRTVIQWDKEDLESLGLLKVDVLALGMLTAIRRSFDLIHRFRGGPRHTLAGIPQEDPGVYGMISNADTIGVFQIESRAQMSMLPRLKPRTYYDLVVEVAIVRPGPIQGGMVHPYLKRRLGTEEVTYPAPGLRKVLERTLGVPIFQEQVMEIAMIAASFSAGEADQLRRAMASWEKRGTLEPFREKLLNGMRQNGYEEKFALQIFEQIKGFGDYGFPESHSASFALLVYISAWLKFYEPAAFTAALLNSQPMGFYAPAQLVRDAREHGVEVRPVDVLASKWDATLERREDGKPALRLGLRLVKGLGVEAAGRLAVAREQGLFVSVPDLMERSGLDRRSLNALADAGALASMSGNRHQSTWDVAGVEAPLPLLGGISIPEGVPLLPQPTEGQDIVADYRALGLTLRRHPLALLRGRLQREQVVTAALLKQLEPGRTVRVGGLVIGRQRPGDGNTIFVTLEDETGQVNLIVWARIAERQRKALLTPGLMLASGTLQRQDGVIHVVARQLLDRSHWLGKLVVGSRDFH